MEESSLSVQSRLVERLVCQSFLQPWIFVPRQDKALARTPRGLASLSKLRLEDFFSSSLLRPQNTFPPRFVDTATVVVELPVSSTSIILPPAVKISGFEQTYYRADALSDDYPAQTTRFTSLDHVKKCASWPVRAKE